PKLPFNLPTDLAPHVGANLDVMRQDTERMRTSAQGRLKPFAMTNLKTLAGVADVIRFIETRGMLERSAPAVG
ncbi:urease accessory protein UreG, partial [Acidovorax delafieldii 2AN]